MTAYFDRLNYSLGDEDSRLEYAVAEAFGAKRILCVAGSGTRATPFLALSPELLTCVDVSERQLAMARVRLRALERLGHDDFCVLMGYRESSSASRTNLLARIVDDPDAELQGLGLKAGQVPPLAYVGRFERTLRSFSTIIRKVLPQRIDELVNFEPGLPDYDDLLRTAVPRRRWNALVWTLGNARLLNAVLYGGAFPAKQTVNSYYAEYSSAMERIFERVGPRRSSLMQMLLFGRLKDPSACLLEADASCFNRMTRGASGCRIEFAHADLAEAATSASYDLVSASDVLSFTRPEATWEMLAAIASGCRIGGVIVLRAHLRLPPPPPAGFVDVSENFREPIRDEGTQLWNVAVYRRDR